MKINFELINLGYLMCSLCTKTQQKGKTKKKKIFTITSIKITYWAT